MFAVQGWAVTAPIKKQTESSPQKNDGEARPGSKIKSAKNLKRKRDREEHVTKENLVSLWKRHIEAEAPEGSAKQKNGEEEESKKQKDTANPQKRKKKKGKASKEGKVEQGDKSDGKNQKPDAIPPRRDLAGDVPTKKKKNKSKTTEAQEQCQMTASATNNKTSNSLKPQEGPTLTPLQASMRAKLTSARFRHLNEKLYTTPSADSFALFAEQPVLFDEYHAGFRQQVSNWPENPVDGYIDEITRRGAIKRAPNPNRNQGGTQDALFPLPRSTGTCTIADLGCGDARLASALQPHVRKLKVRILSYDLHAPHPLVTPADMASLPLEHGTVDVAVFCLALMGTNWPDFIDEAYRILRWQGELWIAEIKSRFSRAVAARGPGGIGSLRTEPENNMLAHSSDSDTTKQTDVTLFLNALQTRGFVLAGPNKDAVDLGNKMFVKMRFLKSRQPSCGKNAGPQTLPGRFPHGKRQDSTRKKFIERDVGQHANEIDETIILKPCVYKLR